MIENDIWNDVITGEEQTAAPLPLLIVELPLD
jgi:hypothetical protein